MYLPRENSQVQAKLEDIENYSIEKDMKMNVTKTKALIFNTSKSMILCEN